MIEQDRVVKRGDVYYADLSDRKGSLQKGIRPVVITQSDHLNRYSTTYIGAAITKMCIRDSRRTELWMILLWMTVLSRVLPSRL